MKTKSATVESLMIVHLFAAAKTACKASVTSMKKIIKFVIGWLEFLRNSVFSLQESLQAQLKALVCTA